MNQEKKVNIDFDVKHKKLYLFFVFLILSGIVVGITTAVSVGISVLIFFLVSAVSFILFLPAHTKVYFSLILVIFSMTIARESFGIPFELDAVSTVILFITLSVSIPMSFLHKSNYVLALPLSGYLISNFLTTYFYSPSFEVSLRQNMILVFRAIIYYLVIIAVTQYPGLRKNYPVWFQRVMVFNILTSTIALLIYPLLQTPFVHTKIDGSIAIKGTFQESNLLGIFALSVTAITLSIFVHSYVAKLRSFILILIGIAGMVLSFTRSTWLGFVVVVGCLGVFLAIKSKKNAKTRFVIGVSLLILILIISLSGLFLFESLNVTSSSFVSSLVERFSQLIKWQETNSVVGRIFIWQKALKSWKQHFWMGTGLLSYGAESFTGESWLYNFIIQSLHDSGLFGTLFLLIFLAGNLFYAQKAFKTAQNERDRGVLLGYILAQIALYFTSLFSSFIWSAFAWTLLGFSMGHSLIVVRMKSTTN